MQKIKVKKDVYEQVTGKLQSSKDDEFREEYDAGFIEGLKSKNIFSRGDFDDWKISDEELLEHCEDVEKSQKGRKEKYPIGYVNETNHTIKVSKTEWKPVPHSKYQPGTLNTERRKLASSLTLITKTEIPQVKIDSSNYLIEGQKYYYEIQKIFQNVTRGHCKAIQNKKVVLQPFSQNHFFDHDVNESVQRTKLLPYVPEIVEQYGVYFDHRVKNHRFEQEIIGKAKIDGKEVIISVCFVSKGDLLFLTIFDTEIKKSLIRGASDIISHSGITGLYTAFTPCDKVFSFNRCSESIIANSKNKSSKIKPDYNGKNMFHKSFDITVTDIAENNKMQKVEQVEKALNAIYENKPFVINHIPADDSKNYGSITLRISNFDKSKIEKAVHKMAFSLDTKVKTSKGEAFTYKAQEQLTDRFVDELTKKTKYVYNFLIEYFGLPEIRIVSKADVMYHGKIIYNPETGQPLTKKEWDDFVNALEKFLNRNYTGIGEKIVLSAQSLGRILERLSQTQSFEQIQKLTLDDIRYKRKTFDWISESSKNMKNVFGESVSRDIAARIEVASRSAAIHVTKITDNMRNDIQQIIIDGVKNRESKSKVSQKLFDKCVSLNRDFQKIADTEIQNNTTSAYIQEEVYNSEEGEKVYFKRFAQIDDNTCSKCKSQKGMIVLFSENALPDENISDPYAKKAIWEGKDWGIPFTINHPYCRCGWYRYYPDLK